jgi:hypothetical protein
MRDYDLAWWLADVVADDLSAAARTAVYLELGGGQYWESITRMLSAAVEHELTVPGVLLSELSRWLDGYLGNVDEPAARTLLTLLARADA